MKKWRAGFRGFAILLSALLVFPAGLMGASSPSAATTIEHTAPGGEYIPGFRINLEATVADNAGLLATRCYFKTKNDQNFAFVDLFDKGGNLYQATLPAPFVNSEAVEYLFVAVNSNKQVTRTEVFMIEEGETEEAATWEDVNEVREVRLDKVQDVAEKFVALYNKAKSGYIKDLPGYQTATGDTALSVKTELAREQVPVKGFLDTATVTEVPAAAKYGFLAEGLYTADAIAAGGGASATGATASAAAEGGGLSTLAWVGIGVGAVGVGALALSGGSSGGGGGGGGGTTPPPTGTRLFALSTPNGPGTQTAPYGIEIIANDSVSVPMTITYRGSSLSSYPGTGTVTINLTNFASGGVVRLTLTGNVSGASRTFHFKTSGGQVTRTITGSTGDYIELTT